MSSQAPSVAVQPDHFRDLSDINIAAFDNPYDALISAPNDDPVRIQERYSTHRDTRNAQQKAKFLAADFAGVMPDPILQRLEDPSIEPGYVDPRHSLVFWARPPPKIKALVAEVQSRLQAIVPNLWLMPQTSLHMTALEITHSRTEADIAALVATMAPAIPAIVNHTTTHRARLVYPQLGYDTSAIALGFVPAARGEGRSRSSSNTDNDNSTHDDAYTYHHLRRDLFALCHAAGVDVASRYVVPSAHLTVARFVTTRDFEDAAGRVDGARVAALVAGIEEVNRWLREEFWPR
ncbi:RNA ligase/cyclic nucleotide phosphodiesterase, partial [Mycena capillaripes]